MELTWADLRERTLARQFPAPAPDGGPPDGVPDVVALVAAVGPLQTQTARSTFLGLAARAPGITRAAIEAAFESGAIVRGSSLRGTVHTTTPGRHPATEVATRLGQAGPWRRALPGLDLPALWAALEEATRPGWCTVDELVEARAAWLAAHAPDVVPRWPSAGAGRYLVVGHGGLIRRPRPGPDGGTPPGAWAGQTTPVYRVLDAVVPAAAQARAAALAGPDAVLDALVARHLRAHGPASRQDLAWWSGLGLTAIDATLARLDLESAPGPDGRTYHDLPGTPRAGEAPGVRLLPEFDAVLSAYEPSARGRFVRPEHEGALWADAKNGLTLAPVLRDGVVTGWWRTTGTGPRRALEVVTLPGAGRVPARRLLDEPVAALEAALGLTVTALDLRRD